MSPILDALANRYCAPHWVFMSEFRNANGFDSSRSADALAFGLYGSRGYALTGFEVKTARSDWLRELKQPEKAEVVGQFCDFFYLVIPAVEKKNSKHETPIAIPEELPEFWGLMTVSSKGFLKTVHKSNLLTPAAMPRYFQAALVKQAMDTVRKPQEKEIQDALEQGRQLGLRQAPDDNRHAAHQLKELREQVAAFTAASGVELKSYSDGAKIGEAVKLVHDMIRYGDSTTLNNLQHAHTIVQTASKRLQEQIDALKAIKAIDLKSRQLNFENGQKPAAEAIA